MHITPFTTQLAQWYHCPRELCSRKEFWEDPIRFVETQSQELVLKSGHESLFDTENLENAFLFCTF